MRGLESNVLYVDVTSGCLLCAFESPVTQSEMVSKGYIDCGDNIELFKALAAMNDENDREQWFTDGYHFELCPTNKADMVAWHMMYRTKPRKATAEEIVQYFKNNER